MSMIQNLKNSMKRSKYLRLLLVVPMVVLFLYCSVTLVNQSADISRMQKQKQTLTAQLASVQQENARLEEVVGADNKDDYIEQKAREKGYVKGDEIVFYDITASYEGRGVMLDVVRETAKKVFVPLTVGGGIKTVDDIRETLRAGADKVSVNSQAVQNPRLIKDGADIFGCQCICVGVDAKKIGENKWTVCINGARVDMHLNLIDWVKQCEQLGAGEICLNSIDTDGVRGGFDLPMLKAVCDAVQIPVIASGGAGKLSDFADAFLETGCSAALAASLFHFRELTVQEVKGDCRAKGIPMR